MRTLLLMPIEETALSRRIRKRAMAMPDVASDKTLPKFNHMGGIDDERRTVVSSIADKAVYCY
jgi:hypothetical protein